MNIKFIEYDGIKGYTRVMYNDVKDADKENCFVDVAYSGKDIKAVLEYLFSLEDRINKAINYMQFIENDYDQDAYMQFKEYKEYQELLNILKGEENEER